VAQRNGRIMFKISKVKQFSNKCKVSYTVLRNYLKECVNLHL